LNPPRALLGALTLAWSLLLPGCPDKAPPRRGHEHPGPATARAPGSAGSGQPAPGGDRREPDMTPARPLPRTLLGGERGLDHVNIATADLAGATEVFHERLGFKRPSSGKLPNGIRNANYYFGDATYLETLTWYDRRKASWVARFTDKHQGGFKIVLSVASAFESARFLEARGIQTVGPIPGSIKAGGTGGDPDNRWYKLLLKGSPLPCDCVFFIDYARERRADFLRKIQREEIRRKYFTHPNTARGIRAAWIAVRDLAGATRAFEAIGLAAGAARESARLDARGREILAGRGVILLLAPRSPGGPVAEFLDKRGPGVLGISVEVGDLRRARALLGGRLEARPPLLRGFFGESLLLPPSAAHGIWLEMFQGRR